MLKGVEIYDLDPIDDKRGRFLKILKNENVDHSIFGEIYLVTILPNCSRGGHYHKKTTEWFFTIKGKGLLLLRNQNGERKSIKIGEKLFTVKVSPHVAHLIKNIGNEPLILLAYADQPYCKENPDTFPISIDE